MGNKRNRRSRKVESQSSDTDESTSETSFTQGNVTLVVVFENIKDIFDRNSGSDLTEPSQTSNEIEASPQRTSEQNSHKMTQNEQQLKCMFEKLLKEIRTNRDSTLANGEDVAKKKKTIDLVLQIQKTSLSGENTHQRMKSIKAKIRISSCSPQKCIN